MKFRLAIEEIEPDHWVAYVLDLPGCFSRASQEQEAIDRAPQCIRQHFSWLRRHGVLTPPEDIPFETVVVERFLPYESEEEAGYLVNAFFEDDMRPLSFWEVEAARRLMDWSRQDLLSQVSSLEESRLLVPVPNEKFATMRGILFHIANAENWYLDRMGLGVPFASLPEEAFERLRVVRANAWSQLPHLIGEERLTRHSGEQWSGRKVVRRLLWHERDHYLHIQQVLASSSLEPKKKRR